MIQNWVGNASFVNGIAIFACFIALGTVSSTGRAQSWKSINDSAMGKTYISSGKLVYRMNSRGSRSVVEGNPGSSRFSMIRVANLNPSSFQVKGIVVNPEESVSIYCDATDRVQLVWQKGSGDTSRPKSAVSRIPEQDKRVASGYNLKIQVNNNVEDNIIPVIPNPGVQNAAGLSNGKRVAEALPLSLVEPFIQINPTSPTPVASGDKAQAEGQENGSEEETPSKTPVPDLIIFDQAPDQPSRLIFQFQDELQVWEAATFWEVLLLCPPAYQPYFAKLLARFNDTWNLEGLVHRTCHAVTKTDLFTMQTDRDILEWTKQLSAESFTVRQQAEERLREKGEAALSYLRSLDLKTLDAETAYRVYRLISEKTSLNQMDQPEDIVRFLSNDSWAVVLLLDSSNANFQSYASKQIQKLFNNEFPYDPQAPEEQRKRQLDILKEKTGFPKPQKVELDKLPELKRQWEQFRKIIVNPEQRKLDFPVLPLRNASK